MLWLMFKPASYATAFQRCMFVCECSERFCWSLELIHQSSWQSYSRVTYICGKVRAGFEPRRWSGTARLASKIDPLTIPQHGDFDPPYLTGSCPWNVAWKKYRNVLFWYGSKETSWWSSLLPASNWLRPDRGSKYVMITQTDQSPKVIFITRSNYKRTCYDPRYRFVDITKNADNLPSSVWQCID